jgi:hypothetical protein
MNRNTALILTLAAVLLCGCPGITACLITGLSFTQTSADLAVVMQQYGFDMSSVGGPDAGMWIGRILWGLTAVVLIAIPIVVWLITSRAARKNAGQG